MIQGDRTVVFVVQTVVGKGCIETAGRSDESGSGDDNERQGTRGSYIAASTGHWLIAPQGFVSSFACLDFRYVCALE